LSKLYALYQQLDKESFSKIVCEIAPYFATIDPLFIELRPGFSEVTMPNTRKVHNHIGTVHAIAMCNLAEIAAGLLTDVSIPEEWRWIPIGMHVRYLAKAKTDLRAISKAEHVDWLTPGEKEVPVSITDSEGTVVCEVTISVKINP
jgi:uncharacterized protein (TIGR00369 family)